MVVIRKINKLKNIKYHQSKLLADKKIITVYYSNNGNTKSVAQNIHSIVGGDIKEIELTEKYPNNIFKMSNLVRNQIKNGDLPNIEKLDISNYDIIFIGSPIWGFSISLPIRSFLKNTNFENKTIIPFFTCSGGVNKNKIHKEVKDLANTTNIKNALFMFENGIFFIKQQIIRWLNNI
jgi:flavodoxin